jgi:Tfp pilus assembly protein PilO
MPRLTETIMKSSQVSRIVISTSLVAIVGLLTYNWAISPQASYLHAAQQYETVSQDVDKKVKILGNTVRVKEVKLKKLQAEMKSVGSSFFSAGQATDFFGQIEKISTAAGCNFESMVFINGETIVHDKNNLESPKITEKKVIVKVAGTYGAIVGFTSTLKDYPMTIYMSDLLIRSIGPSTDKLSCSMRLKVYITKDKELLLDE